MSVSESETDGKLRRRLPEERPGQILEAALAEFGERGLAGARLDDIARRAGVAKGTIYLYFPNKEALFREVVLTTIVARIEEVERAALATQGTTTELLGAFMQLWWDILRSPHFSTLHRLVISELRSFPDVAEFYSREVIARMHRMVGGIIERGVVSGEFRDVVPRVAARMISSMFVSQALWCGHRQAFKGVDFPTDDGVAFAELSDFVLHAIGAIPPAPPAALAAPE